MKKEKTQLPMPYKPPENRSAIDEILNQPLEQHYEKRYWEGIDAPDGHKGTLETALDPRGPMAILQEEMRTPKGNGDAINGIINKWITQRLAFDGLYTSKILAASPCDDNLPDIDLLYQRKHKNENIILKLFAAKKKLLTLPGISFTQVNHSHGPQQVNNGPVNNGPNGNEKSGGKI